MQLCYYKNDTGNSTMPNTSPGLFVGWRFESGIRYRNVVYIVDYETVRKGDFRWRSAKSVPEAEVYVPPDIFFFIRGS